MKNRRKIEKLIFAREKFWESLAFFDLLPKIAKIAIFAKKSKFDFSPRVSLSAKMPKK